jgi:predicted site-specific integrase-resolvase
MAIDYQPELLSRRAAAGLLGISVETLTRWKKQGRGPRPMRLTPGSRGRVIYRRCDLVAFAADPEQAQNWPAQRFPRPAMAKGIT